MLICLVDLIFIVIVAVKETTGGTGVAEKTSLGSLPEETSE